MNNGLCEAKCGTPQRVVEPIGSVLNSRVDHLMEVISNNTEYIANIHSKLDGILFPRNIPEECCDKEKTTGYSDDLWGHLDTLESMLYGQKREIMELYERLER